MATELDIQYTPTHNCTVGFAHHGGVRWWILLGFGFQSRQSVTWVFRKIAENQLTSKEPLSPSRRQQRRQQSTQTARVWILHWHCTETTRRNDMNWAKTTKFLPWWFCCRFHHYLFPTLSMSTMIMSVSYYQPCPCC